MDAERQKVEESADRGVPHPPSIARRPSWLERFAAVPGQGRQIPYLDGVRGLAVLAIFLRHVWGLSGSPEPGPTILGRRLSLSPSIAMLSSGVDLFFVLSGFLLARAFLQKEASGSGRVDIGTYYRQRFWRIAPPYWVALVGVLLLYVPSLIPEQAVYSRNGLWIFVAHVLFLQTAFLPAYGSYIIASPFWTLTIEALFYLSLPLLVHAFHRRRALWSVPLALVLTLGWLYLARYSLGPLVRFLMTHSLWPFPEWMVRFFLSKTFPAHLFDFAVGIAVARLVLRRPGTEESRAGTRAGLFALVLGLLWLVLFLQLQGHNTVLHGWWDPERLTHSESASALAYYFLEQVGVAPAFGLLLFAAVRGPPIFDRALSIAPLRVVGVVGYSVYLVHMPLLYQMNTLHWVGSMPPGRVRLLVALCFGALLVALVATSMFLAVEKPAMAMAKRQRFRARPAGGESER